MRLEEEKASSCSDIAVVGHFSVDTIKLPTRKAPKPAVKPVQHKSIKKPKPIRLVGLEEHRCPYCLELVEENDPAGVVVCPICHANHHKSCWDISGTCQVPHIQS